MSKDMEGQRSDRRAQPAHTSALVAPGWLLEKGTEGKGKGARPNLQKPTNQDGGREQLVDAWNCRVSDLATPRADGF